MKMTLEYAKLIKNRFDELDDNHPYEQTRSSVTLQSTKLLMQTVADEFKVTSNEVCDAVMMVLLREAEEHE
jgi:hypothetical protein